MLGRRGEDGAAPWPGASFQAQSRGSPSRRSSENKRILVLPGDGIGNEVMAEVLKIMEWMEKTKSLSFDVSQRLVGGTAYDKEGDSISDETMQVAVECDAVLFGAVGGSKWDNVERK